ncbi:MAG: DUF4340 domain-containing protein [Anaerolineae bacterium]|nr:DUF4340 domain-containing protein [Anaerolineae bacterium]
MKLRNTSILLVVLIIVGGYVYYTEGRPQSQPPNLATAVPAVEPVLTIDSAQVLTITVQGLPGLTRLSRADAKGPWQMDTTVAMTPTVSGPQEADPVRANNVLSTISYITANRVLTGVTDLAAYGLASPSWSVIVEGAGQVRHTIYLGDQNPDGSSYYAKREGSETVYLIAAYVGDDLRNLVESPPAKPTPTPTPTPGATGTPLPVVSPTATPTSTPSP